MVLKSSCSSVMAKKAAILFQACSSPACQEGRRPSSSLLLPSGRTERSPASKLPLPPSPGRKPPSPDLRQFLTRPTALRHQIRSSFLDQVAAILQQTGSPSRPGLPPSHFKPHLPREPTATSRRQSCSALSGPALRRPACSPQKEGAFMGRRHKQTSNPE